MSVLDFNNWFQPALKLVPWKQTSECLSSAPWAGRPFQRSWSAEEGQLGLPWWLRVFLSLAIITAWDNKRSKLIVKREVRAEHLSGPDNIWLGTSLALCSFPQGKQRCLCWEHQLTHTLHVCTSLSSLPCYFLWVSTYPLLLEQGQQEGMINSPVTMQMHLWTRILA